MLLTQNQISLIILSSSHLSDERRKKLITLLPELYTSVQNSLLLDEKVAEDFLVLLHMMDDEQIDACQEAIAREDEYLQEIVTGIVESGGERFEQELTSILTSGKKVLRDTGESVSKMEEGERMEEIEHFFDEEQ